MSYQSIKRVLGETSLERKCRFLFGGCLLILIMTSFYWYGQQTEKLLFERNSTMARAFVDQEMVIIHWKEFETIEDFKPVVEDMTKAFSTQEYECVFLGPENTAGKITPADEFEFEVLDLFMNADENTPAFVERPLSAGSEYYEYYQPIHFEETCALTCHDKLTDLGVDTGVTTLAGGGLNQAPLAAGDLMAVANISIPNGPTQKALNVNKAILLATAIITVFLAMIASYVIVRYVIVKPLRHLRDVSDAISHGNIALRADIHTGDEFESLAVSFNRMLRNLVSVQNDLRQANTDLDTKVDELAQMNMRLYETNTIKSDFLATMSHELRTPLNSILGFSDVLGAIDSLDDKQRRYVGNIQTSGRILLEMINDILDLAKIESGKMETRPTDFQLAQIIGAQCDMAKPLAEKKNIGLEVKIPDGLPMMCQDQARVQQILNNLLSNAIKFTPEGGRITVSADRDDEDYLVMRISDTGVGIAEEDQHAIFEKFRQGNAAAPSGDAMTREYSGTGLGLSIVKELCKLLGGEISVQSELGKGSVFTVRLPRRLQQQPRLDSSLVEGFEEFTKPRFELRGDRRSTVA
ncbi:MAG TPA: ATP-binding protein [Thermoguttaceae bacterium]|nr:ATP-binding protein [Thermoguttaceae bacterium]